MLVDQLIANDDDDAKIELLMGFLSALGAADSASVQIIDRAFEEEIARAPNAMVAGQLRKAWAGAGDAPARAGTALSPDGTPCLSLVLVEAVE